MQNRTADLNRIHPPGIRHHQPTTSSKPDLVRNLPKPMEPTNITIYQRHLRQSQQIRLHMHKLLMQATKTRTYLRLLHQPQQIQRRRDKDHNVHRKPKSRLQPTTETNKTNHLTPCVKSSSLQIKLKSSTTQKILFVAVVKNPSTTSPDIGEHRKHANTQFYSRRTYHLEHGSKTKHRCGKTWFSSTDKTPRTKTTKYPAVQLVQHRWYRQKTITQNRPRVLQYKKR
jgi:hypothetical protein